MNKSTNMVFTTRGPLPRASLIRALVVEETDTAVTIAVEWRVKGEGPRGDDGLPVMCLGGEIVRRDAWVSAKMPLTSEATAQPLGG